MTLVNITAVMWMVACILFLCGLRKWNKRFEALYEELKGVIRNESI